MNLRTRAGATVLAGVLGLGLGVPSWASPQAPHAVDRAETEANITRLTTALLAGSQFAHHPLDDQLAGKLLDRYLEALDGNRSLFLQSDIDEFAGYRAQLAQATRVAGDTSAARAIFARYLERLGQQVAYDAEKLRSGSFEFAGHDVYTFDRKQSARPRDLAAVRELWQQGLRAEYLQEKLSDKKPTRDAIVVTLTKRHAQQLRTMKALDEDEVLETYLDALTHVYDPHSDYLGHEEMESLSIAMNLSLAGIGATLTSEDGFCTIKQLVPGSPAARSGRLKPGERIVAVGQGAAAVVDVTDMPLTRIVDLIRGPKGSVVMLTILPQVGAAGAPESVRLVRDEIKLEDQQAKASIVDMPPRDGKTVRLGVIDLPSFYSDREHGTHGGATADVAKLLAKLTTEHVQGVVLDLRRNGGGSLDEAISLAGLFIKQGPVVQTRDFKNAIEVDKDPDPAVVYDGPLVVLTSRFSASASEIVAGALQDYGRAVIVGDSATFGKGTVQSITPLAPIMDRAGLGHSFDPGALKVTVSKFYRPSGASTELRGVGSDIVLPSPSEVAGVSEATLTDPLPWDTVPAARYERENRVQPYLPALRDKSARRVDAERAFVDLREEVTELKQRLADGTISLNEAARRRQMAASKARDLAIDKEARAMVLARITYPITVRAAALPGLPARLVVAPASTSASQTVPPSDSHGGGADPAGDDLSSDDVISNESLLILGDYVSLLAPTHGDVHQDASAVKGRPKG
jgi:carboxyl-terminal processing protease